MTVLGPVLRQAAMTNDAIAPAEISAVVPMAVDRLQTGAGALSPAIEPDERDRYRVTAFADIADRSLHAAIARLTGGLSPAALAQAYWDWATHLAAAPGKRMQLVDKAVRKAMRFGNYAYRYAARRPERGTLHRAAAAGSPLPR